METNKLKTGMLMMLVGIAIIGMAVSSVSAYNYSSAECKYSSGSYCDAFDSYGNGYCTGYCACASHTSISIYVNCYYTSGIYMGWNGCNCGY